MTVEDRVATARIDLADLPEALDQPRGMLLDRPAGSQAFSRCRECLEQLPNGGTLLVSLEGIEYITASFADEALANLQAGLVAWQYGDKFLVIGQPNESVAYEIALVVDQRRPRVPVLVQDKDGTLRVLGRTERNLLDAWELVRTHRELRARDLADRYQIEITAASMRLHKLYTARLLARETEMTSAGRQHVYRLPA